MGTTAEFLFLGAHPALDFVNTRTVDRGQVVERLESDAALLRWAGAAGLAPATALDRWAAAEAAEVLAPAVALREALRAWFAGVAPIDALLERVNALLAAHGPSVRLARAGERVVRAPALDGRGPEALLGLLAGLVADLLCDVSPRDVRRCAAPDCEAWFRVAGRTVERRWCSDARCGRRVRSARHERTRRRVRFRR